MHPLSRKYINFLYLISELFGSVRKTCSRSIENWCHQMSDFKAKMHQIRFPLGLCPRPCWGSLQRSPDLIVVFKGPTSKEREGKEKERRKGKEGENDRMHPVTNCSLCHCNAVYNWQHEKKSRPSTLMTACSTLLVAISASREPSVGFQPRVTSDGSRPEITQAIACAGRSM